MSPRSRSIRARATQVALAFALAIAIGGCGSDTRTTEVTTRPDGSVVTTYPNGYTRTVFADGATVERSPAGNWTSQSPSISGKYHAPRPKPQKEAKARFKQPQVIAALGLTPLPHAHSGGSGDDASWVTPGGCWVDGILNRPFDLRDAEELYDERFLVWGPGRDVAVMISGQHDQDLISKREECRRELRERLRTLR